MSNLTTTTNTAPTIAAAMAASSSTSAASAASSSSSSSDAVGEDTKSGKNWKKPPKEKQPQSPQRQQQQQQQQHQQQQQQQREKQTQQQKQQKEKQQQQQQQQQQPPKEKGKQRTPSASPVKPQSSSERQQQQQQQQQQLQQQSSSSLPLLLSQSPPTTTTSMASLDGGESSSAPEPKKQPPTRGPSNVVPSSLQFDDVKARTKVEKYQLVQRVESQKQVRLFSHLPQYERGQVFTSDISLLGKSGIHPAVVQLGLRYLENQIVGANARCIAMLTAFKQMIKDYRPPDNEYLRHFDSLLKANVNYLTHYRPLAVSMGNAIRSLKRQIAAITDKDEDAVKDYLIEGIDRYIQEQIVYADAALAQNAVSKIHSGDVILTFGCSSVVQRILLGAHDEKKQFRVIIVDSRPKLEGRVLLQRLVKHGVSCTYVLINAMSYIMKEVSKVILGATSMFSNGYMMGRLGTASVAVMAASFNVPVLVCCETYKFSERVQLDSFVFNELGDPDDLKPINGHETQADVLTEWRDIPPLKLLNLFYDVTPMQYISVVVTEIGLVPATSVPVVLREYQP